METEGQRDRDKDRERETAGGPGEDEGWDLVLVCELRLPLLHALEVVLLLPKIS